MLVAILRIIYSRYDLPVFMFSPLWKWHR